MSRSEIPSNETPAALGYRMPAEWERHDATWLSWPHNRDSWPGKFEPVPDVFATIIKHLTETEIVNINVGNEEMKEKARRLLAKHRVEAARVRFHLIPTNDSWVRDHGAIFVTRGVEGRSELAAVKWRYNAWGMKYPFELDDQVARKMARELAVPVFEGGLVLEGGSIDVNGRGTLLTTESCLLNPNRNPDKTKSEIEQALKDYLGVRLVLWLGDGIDGDDTDGHIDDLARFVDSATIVTVVESDPSDPNYQPLRDNLERLRTMTDDEGGSFEIVTLPMPPRMDYRDQRLPASYANFYIANETVLVPTFDAATDRVALETLERVFPRRRIVGINCIDLVWGLGAIHCITQQQPAV